MRRIYALPVIALLAAAPFALAQQDNAPDLPAPDYQYTPPLADEAPGADAPDAGGSMAEGGDLMLKAIIDDVDHGLRDSAQHRRETYEPLKLRRGRASDDVVTADCLNPGSLIDDCHPSLLSPRSGSGYVA